MEVLGQEAPVGEIPEDQWVERLQQEGSANEQGLLKEECRLLFFALQERLRSLAVAFEEDKLRLQEDQRKASADANSERERQAWIDAYENALDTLTREHRADMQAVHADYARKCQGDQEHEEQSLSGPVQEYCTDPALSDLLEHRFDRRMAQIRENQARDEAIFKTLQDQRRAAFETSDNQAREDRRTFAEEEQLRQEAFEVRLDLLKRSMRAELRESEYEYLGEVAGRCDPHQLRAVDTGERAHKEAGLVRFECELEAGRTAGQEAADVSQKQCQDRLDALWDERLRSLQTVPRVDRFGQWAITEAEHNRTQLEGRFVTTTAYPELGTFAGFTVGATLFMDRLSTINGTPLQFEPQDQGSGLLATGAGYHLEFVDNPTGLLRYALSEGGQLQLQLPKDAQVERTSSGYELNVGRDRAVIRALTGDVDHNGELGVLTVSGQGIFYVPGGSSNVVLPAAANQYRHAIMQAVEDRRLGAEVTVTAAGQGGPRHEALVYEEIELDLHASPEDRRVAVTVASDSLQQGRAFVVNIDRGLIDPQGRLTVQYYDVDPETGSETPVVIERAASLTGLLSRTNGADPAYWTVAGGDGLQWIVFVPHWSVHKFTITSEDAHGRFEIPVTPILMSVVVAAVGMFVRVTRRDP